MYPLLMLREEVICLILLILLWINGHFHTSGKDRGSFRRITLFATGHVVFDILTILTVNYADHVPKPLGTVACEAFYLFAILFSQELFCYISELCFPGRVVKYLRLSTLLPLALYAVALPFVPIDYVENHGVRYGYGTAVFIGYALALALFVGGLILIFTHYKRLEPRTRHALIPMLVGMIAAECIQIVVPELLITGGVVTVVAVGFFFTIENPAGVFKQKLMTDALTGVKSRHGYEADILQMEKAYARDPSLRFCMVFFDIDHLKAVNDKYGHLEGDAYIGRVARALTSNLRHVEGIYRMGGDEFFAVYRDKEEDLIRGELDGVRRECEEAGRKVPYRIGVAIGVAVSEKKYATLRDVLRVADYRMYQNKAEMKKPLAFTSDDVQDLNISGLTDRIFDAFAATGDRNYLTLCNMSTNVSRWSKSAVDYFGLPGEFIFDCMTLWMEYVHPDDVADYRADIAAVFSGKKKYHDLEYRVRNKQGQYVMCTCRGTILKGKNGEPDMFAATLVNHGIAENIDPITGLYNEQRFIEHAEDVIREGMPRAFLYVNVCMFDRINLLYGYDGGNEVLRRFTEIVKQTMNPGDRLFRMHGTRFLLSLADADAARVTEFYATLQETVRETLRMNDTAIGLHLAGGAFLLPEKFEGGVSTLRNDLTVALNCSRNEHHGRLIFYRDHDESRGAEEDYRLLSAIHSDATEARMGFYLEYQPILRMDDGHVIGAEALLRWRSDEFGEVGPMQFIPWLENDPCFFQVGKWIFRKALTDIGRLLAQRPDFIVNVNVTVLQLEDERFDAMLLDVLRETGFPPQNLYLELTERCRELDMEFLKSKIEFFHKAGIRVALDDIGTGFSSLDILLHLPVDEIKLDKAFIKDICTQKVNQIFVRAITDAASRLGYQCCVEGVEDEETYRHLQTYAANTCQGFYFSGPLPFWELSWMVSGQKGKNTDKTDET